MIKEDIIKLYNVIQAEKNKGNVKFRYLLLKNEKIIKQEVDTFTEMEKEISKIIEPFEKERDKLIKSIGMLDKNTGVYSIPNNSEKIAEFNKKLDPIRKKYNKLFEEHDTKYKEYVSILKEDIEEPLKFAEIEFENLPQDIKTESMELFINLGILK